jgi:hypothetical protein
MRQKGWKMRLIDADAIPWNVDGVGEIPVITKEEIDRLPTVEAIVLKPSLLKHSEGGYILYKREWLYRHLEQEFNILARVSRQRTLTWMQTNADLTQSNTCDALANTHDALKRKEE